MGIVENSIYCVNFTNVIRLSMERAAITIELSNYNSCKSVKKNSKLSASACAKISLKNFNGNSKNFIERVTDKRSLQ